MKIELRFRKPTRLESEILQHLLTAADFSGKDELERQLHDFRVRTIDDEGSFEIDVPKLATPASVKKRIPVEAQGVDEDGIHIHLLLHIVHGFARELEIYKEDGSQIHRMPKATDFEIVVLPA